MHPLLDRPVWASLTSCHADLSVGGSLARRYLADVNLFASAREDTDADLEALAMLVRPGEQIYVLQAAQIRVPAGLTAVKRARGLQMVASSAATFGAACAQITSLTAIDGPDMLALARLTEPGPFLERTHAMVSFFGIRIEGRLVAMAGERFRFPGHTEVSGVCTHPDFRGRGFARQLSACVAAHIVARGERPFLHAWTSNRPAISLYESLGFEARTEVNVAILCLR